MNRLPLVKYCGFKNSEAIAVLRGLGVDMVGFILAPSRRRVQIDQLAILTKAVPTGIAKVGVFVNPTMDEIRNVLQQAELDIIQLHGEESPTFCSEVCHSFGVRIIKAFHVGKEDGIDLRTTLDSYKEVIDYLLLDTYDPSEAGGTGRAFRWEVLGTYYEWCNEHNIKLIVAGGLHKDNIVSLLDNWPLHGIDISSGIETDGQKDRTKMIEFMERVKGNDRST
ncbi:MAG TPA: phosphoribosylanthranilate isomerase [Bacillota bacterium]|nr:phosphoribosylanthranilate isomerase [Bacillota bacterium]